MSDESRTSLTCAPGARRSSPCSTSRSVPWKGEPPLVGSSSTSAPYWYDPSGRNPAARCTARMPLRFPSVYTFRGFPVTIIQKNEESVIVRSRMPSSGTRSLLSVLVPASAVTVLTAA